MPCCCRGSWRSLRLRILQFFFLRPASAWVDSIEDVLAWLGKRRDWNQFETLVAQTRQARPALLPWLERYPTRALALADKWTRLLAVVGWVMDHPRPGIYLRQVDLPGVHTKFIEAHRGVLSELLDLALPGDAVEAAKSGVGLFAGRYGFSEKPIRIRFRVLDPALQVLPGIVCPDITLDAESLSSLSPPVRRVFITENEINFLAFPQIRDSIVIFGAGYGWEALARSRWLNNCTVYYWGDIDTHGFAILNQLRGQFAHVESFLMDSLTLDAHRAAWGVEDRPYRGDLTRLTAAERDLYDDLRDNRIREALRLEQELIGFDWVCAHFDDSFLEQVRMSPGADKDD